MKKLHKSARTLRNNPKGQQSMDKLSLENVIRKRYNQNWPETMIELLSRVQNVNQTWARLIVQLLSIPNLSFRYYRDGDNLVVEVKHGNEAHLSRVPIETVQNSMDHIEVIVMNEISKSPLLEKAARGG